MTPPTSPDDFWDWFVSACPRFGPALCDIGVRRWGHAPPYSYFAKKRSEAISLKIIDIHTHIYPDAIARKATDSIRDFYQL